jgi:pimeloyl-ACP methyl ester carboxylesterase
MSAPAWIEADDGLRLAAHRLGDGPAAVFQHGLGADASQPQGLFPTDTFACWTLECRGHGDSPMGPEERVTIAQSADDLGAMIAALGLGPCPVGGISMGAAIALRLAVTRPDLVSELMLVRPAWVTDAVPDNLAPNAEVARLLASLPPADARAAFEDSDIAGLFRREAPDNLTSLRGFFERPPLSETATLLGRIANDGPGVAASDLSGLACPTLVIGHDRDAIHPWAHAEALAGLIPGAGLLRVTPKADDPVRHRDDVCNALRTFLSEVT